MLSWSAKRQLTIIGIGALVVLVIIVLPSFFIFYKAPTCFDGKQNQGEGAVDCGGPCQLLCKSETLDPIVRWQRVFPVSKGVYNAVAYVENPNFNSGIRSVPYLFKVYGTDNLIVYERRGQTFIPPRKVFAIFETGIITGERTPARTTFEFTSPLSWQRGISFNPEIRIKDKIIQSEESSPRLEATLENPNVIDIANVEVVAIVYDLLGNAMASSKTIVDNLSKDNNAHVVFTWPEPFSSKSAKIELIYRVLPR